MASSNSLEPWSFRPTFSDSWFSDAFTRDTETLTRALQKSLTTTHNNNNNNYYPQTETETITTSLKSLIDESTSNNNNNNNNSLFQYLVKSEQIPTPTGSVSDPDTNILMGANNNNNHMDMVVPKRRNAAAIGTTTSTSGNANGKISKRKSRASKRSPTTFIAADPSNFRQMVQQVTGIQFCHQQQPSVTSVLKPEPHRPGGTRIQHQQQHQHNNNYSLALPTLDTSAFLLDNTNNSNHRQFTATTTTTTSNSNAPVVLVVDDGIGIGIGGGAPATATASGGLDFENFPSFPTLESWKGM